MKDPCSTSIFQLKLLQDEAYSAHQNRESRVSPNSLF
jgi:hypothetical protein